MERTHREADIVKSAGRAQRLDVEDAGYELDERVTLRLLDADDTRANARVACDLRDDGRVRHVDGDASRVLGGRRDAQDVLVARVFDEEATVDRPAGEDRHMSARENLRREPRGEKCSQLGARLGFYIGGEL